jgi:hypothetical protein
LCKFAISETYLSDLGSVLSDFDWIDSDPLSDLNRNTRAKVSSFSFDLQVEANMVSGLVGGAESISNLVEEKIGKLVAHDKPNRAWLLDQFRRQFDECYKRRFGLDDDNDSYVFRLPGEELELSR